MNINASAAAKLSSYAKDQMLETIATTSGKMWIAKSTKGIVYNEDPKAAMIDFSKKFGTRSDVTFSENNKANGMLMFERGCRMTKGKYKDVLAQATIWSGEAVANTNESIMFAKAAYDAVSPASYQAALRGLHSMMESREIIVNDEDDTLKAGRSKNNKVAWITENGYHKLTVGNKTKEFKARLGTRLFVTSIFQALQNSTEVKAGAETENKKLTRSFASKRSLVLARFNKQLFQRSVVAWSRLLNKTLGIMLNDSTSLGLIEDLYLQFVQRDTNRPTDTTSERNYVVEFLLSNKNKIIKLTEHNLATAAGETLSDRVSSIIFGDVKRIRSTIASWKGKMKPEEYKEFVTYQKDIARFIREKYVQKLSTTYQEKLKTL